MFQLIGKFPIGHFHLACSGGSDSMIFVDFLQRYPKHKFDLLYFNHGTDCCNEAQQFVEQYAKDHNLEVHIDNISNYPEKQKCESQEEYWRHCRYEFLSKFKSEPIVMCHHLNDVIETWVMTCMSGKPSLIPYYNPKYNIIRPFLCVSKKQIKDWKHRHNVDHVVDGSNYDVRIKRNYVRHRMMEHIYHINPGIEKTIRKLIQERVQSQIDDYNHDHMNVYKIVFANVDKNTIFETEQYGYSEKQISDFWLKHSKKYKILQIQQQTKGTTNEKVG